MECFSIRFAPKEPFAGCYSMRNWQDPELQAALRKAFGVKDDDWERIVSMDVTPAGLIAKFESRAPCERE